MRRKRMIEFLDQYIQSEYEVNTAVDVENALLDMFGGLIEKMLEGEMDSHLGYGRYEASGRKSGNSRNGKGSKKIQTKLGPVSILTPRDRDGSFEPQIVPKRQTDVVGIEDKVLSLYGKGLSTRNISDSLKDIYQFELSHEMVSNITDKILPEIAEWRQRPLKPIYPIIYLDALVVPMKDGVSSVNRAVYSIIGVDTEGRKDILAISIGENESASYWMGLLDELKGRGVKDICIACVDGLSGFKQAIQAVFPQTIVQRCIVHLIRQSTKTVPTKDRKAFCADLRQIYQAINLEMSKKAFEAFKENWASAYPMAVRTWENNIEEVYQIFGFPQEIRRLIYTTNAVESYNSQLRKVTNGKGAFPNENSLMKLLYLRTKEVTKNWYRQIPNWGLIINQFVILYPERFSPYL